MSDEPLAVRILVGAMLVAENAQCTFESREELDQKLAGILTEAKLSDEDKNNLTVAFRRTDEYIDMLDRALENEVNNEDDDDD